MAASSPTWCARACISRSAEALFPTAGRTFARIVEMKDRSSHRARVLRYGGEAGARVDDQLAAEEPLELRIGGQPLTLMMRTPGHDRDLALGFLFGEGIIRSADDVTGLTVVPNGEHPDLENVIDVALSPSAPGVDRRWQRNFLSASSCGLCGVSSIEAIHEAAPPLPDDDLAIDPEVIYGLDARLREEQAIFARTGGLHAAGLFTLEGEPVAVREDIGRHNAVDKVIGHAAGRGLLPLDLAQASNQTLIGFLRGRSLNVYSGRQRIQQ